MRRWVAVVGVVLLLAAAMGLVLWDDDRPRPPTPDTLVNGDLPQHQLDAASAQDRRRNLEASRDGVRFRADLSDGSGRSMVSLETNGRVVYVWDTSVFSDTRDYQSLRLDPDGTVALANEVIESLLDQPSGAGIPISNDGTHVGTARPALADRLRDLSWLAAHIIEPLAPWIPEELSLAAHVPRASPPSPLRPDDPFATWPLATPIDQLAHSLVEGPYGTDRAICLTGDDVGPVFALLTGVNTAYLRIDDGRRWELTVTVLSPGWQPWASACTD
jgi:hypothetical protein